MFTDTRLSVNPVYLMEIEVYCVSIGPWSKGNNSRKLFCLKFIVSETDSNGQKCPNDHLP
jgi:hypothetical protein